MYTFVYRVYVKSLSGIGSHSEVEIDWKENSCSLRVNNFDGKNYVLNLDPLNDEISNATFSQDAAKDRLIVKLEKVKSHDWFDLKKK